MLLKKITIPNNRFFREHVITIQEGVFEYNLPTIDYDESLPDTVEPIFEYAEGYSRDNTSTRMSQGKIDAYGNPVGKYFGYNITRLTFSYKNRSTAEKQVIGISIARLEEENSPDVPYEEYKLIYSFKDFDVKYLDINGRVYGITSEWNSNLQGYDHSIKIPIYRKDGDTLTIKPCFRLYGNCEESDIILTPKNPEKWSNNILNLPEGMNDIVEFTYKVRDNEKLTKTITLYINRMEVPEFSEQSLNELWGKISNGYLYGFSQKRSPNMGLIRNTVQDTRQGLIFFRQDNLSNYNNTNHIIKIPTLFANDVEVVRVNYNGTESAPAEMTDSSGEMAYKFNFSYSVDSNGVGNGFAMYRIGLKNPASDGNKPYIILTCYAGTKSSNYDRVRFCALSVFKRGTTPKDIYWNLIENKDYGVGETPILIDDSGEDYFIGVLCNHLAGNINDESLEEYTEGNLGVAISNESGFEGNLTIFKIKKKANKYGVNFVEKGHYTNNTRRYIRLGRLNNAIHLPAELPNWSSGESMSFDFFHFEYENPTVINETYYISKDISKVQLPFDHKYGEVDFDLTGMTLNEQSVTFKDLCKIDFPLAEDTKVFTLKIPELPGIHKGCTNTFTFERIKPDRLVMFKSHEDDKPFWIQNGGVQLARYIYKGAQSDEITVNFYNPENWECSYRDVTTQKDCHFYTRGIGAYKGKRTINIGVEPNEQHYLDIPFTFKRNGVTKSITYRYYKIDSLFPTMYVNEQEYNSETLLKLPESTPNLKIKFGFLIPDAVKYISYKNEQYTYDKEFEVPVTGTGTFTEAFNLISKTGSSFSVYVKYQIGDISVKKISINGQELNINGLVEREYPQEGSFPALGLFKNLDISQPLAINVETDSPSTIAEFQSSTHNNNLLVPDVQGKFTFVEGVNYLFLVIRNGDSSLVKKYPIAIRIDNGQIPYLTSLSVDGTTYPPEKYLLENIEIDTGRHKSDFTKIPISYEIANKNVQNIHIIDNVYDNIENGVYEFPFNDQHGNNYFSFLFSYKNTELDKGVNVNINGQKLEQVRVSRCHIYNGKSTNDYFYVDGENNVFYKVDISQDWPKYRPVLYIANAEQYTDIDPVSITFDTPLDEDGCFSFEPGNFSKELVATVKNSTENFKVSINLKRSAKCKITNIYVEGRSIDFSSYNEKRVFVKEKEDGDNTYTFTVGKEPEDTQITINPPLQDEKLVVPNYGVNSYTITATKDGDTLDYKFEVIKAPKQLTFDLIKIGGETFTGTEGTFKLTKPYSIGQETIEYEVHIPLKCISPNASFQAGKDDYSGMGGTQFYISGTEILKKKGKLKFSVSIDNTVETHFFRYQDYGYGYSFDKNVIISKQGIDFNLTKLQVGDKIFTGEQIKPLIDFGYVNFQEDRVPITFEVDTKNIRTIFTPPLQDNNWVIQPNENELKIELKDKFSIVPTKTYNVKLFKLPYGDAILSFLKVGIVSFKRDEIQATNVLEEVPFVISERKVEYTLSDENAGIKFTPELTPEGKWALEVGDNELRIEVFKEKTFENLTHTYTLKLKRSEATTPKPLVLTSIEVNDELRYGTAIEETMTFPTVPFTTEKVIVNAVTYPSNAQITFTPPLSNEKEWTLNQGANELNLHIEGNGLTLDYTINLERAADFDVSLTSLSLGDELKNPVGDVFTFEVPFEKNEVSITAVADPTDGSEIKYVPALTPEGKWKFVEGLNAFKAIVIKGTKRKEYFVNVTRAFEVIGLKTLTVNSQPVPMIKNYMELTEVEHTVDKVSVVVEKTPDTANVTFTPELQETDKWVLSYGTNILKIDVEKGVVKKTYIIKQERQAAPVPDVEPVLKSLFIGNEFVGEESIQDTVALTNVPFEINSVKVNLQAYPTTEIIYSPSLEVGNMWVLNEGLNTLEVTLKNGTAQKTYNITLTRDASFDVNLTHLVIDTENKVPTGANEIIFEVENNKSEIEVSSEATPLGAVVTYVPELNINKWSLEVGLNIFKVIVTKGDKRKEYTVKATRKAQVVEEVKLLTLSVNNKNIDNIQTFMVLDNVTPDVEKVPVVITKQPVDSIVTFTPALQETDKWFVNTGLNTLQIELEKEGKKETYIIQLTKEGSVVAPELEVLYVGNEFIGEAQVQETMTLTNVPFETDKVKVVVQAEPITEVIYNPPLQETDKWVLEEGLNNLEITLKNSTEHKVYNLKLTREALVDVSLTNITVDGEIKVPSSQNDIIMEVPESKAEVEIASTVFPVGADIKFFPPLVGMKWALNKGLNIFTIIVSKEGKSKEYTARITRKEEELKLLTLSVNGNEIIPIKPLMKAENVLHTVDKVAVTVTKQPADTVVTFVPNLVETDKWELSYGLNTLQIEIEKEGKKVVYLVQLTREVAPNTDVEPEMIGLKIGKEVRTREGISDDIILNNVPHSVESVEVDTEALNSQNVVFTPSLTGKTWNLSDGLNTLTIKFTNGNANKTYTVKLTRDVDYEVSLTSLILNGDVKDITGATLDVSVPFATNEMTVDSVVSPVDCEVEYYPALQNGKWILATGVNKNIVVVKKEGKRKEYVINITRGFEELKFTGLNVNGQGITPIEHTNIIDDVDHTVDRIPVTVQKTPADAIVTYNPSLSGSNWSLSEGKNKLLITLEKEGRRVESTIVVNKKPAPGAIVYEEPKAISVVVGSEEKKDTDIQDVMTFGSVDFETSKVKAFVHADPATSEKEFTGSFNKPTSDWSLNQGNNTLRVKLKNGDKSKEYTLNVERKAEITLAEISLDEIKLNDVEGTLVAATNTVNFTELEYKLGGYTLPVTFKKSREDLEIITLLDNVQTIGKNVTAQWKLNIGDNSVKIVVLRKGAIKKTYTLNVKVKAEQYDFALNEITINGNKFTNVNHEVPTNVGLVEHSVSSVQIETPKYLPIDANIFYVFKSGGSISGNTWNLNVGLNIISVVLKKGSLEKVYTFLIERAKNVFIEPVKVHAVSVGKEYKIGSAVTSDMTFTNVPFETKKVPVTVSAAPEGTLIEYEPNLVGNQWDLEVGQNTLVVKATKDTQIKTYNIKLSRERALTPTLTSLSVGLETKQAGLIQDTMRFNEVAYGVDKVSVVPVYIPNTTVVTYTPDLQGNKWVLNPGENELEIKLDNQGEVKKYKVLIKRSETPPAPPEPDKPRLTKLVVGSTTVDNEAQITALMDFGIVDNNIENIIVATEQIPVGSTVEFTPELQGNKWVLQEGINRLGIKVINGVKNTIYSITITRQVGGSVPIPNPPQQGGTMGKSKYNPQNFPNWGKGELGVVEGEGYKWYKNSRLKDHKIFSKFGKRLKDFFFKW